MSRKGGENGKVNMIIFKNKYPGSRNRGTCTEKARCNAASQSRRINSIKLCVSLITFPSLINI